MRKYLVISKNHVYAKCDSFKEAENEVWHLSQELAPDVAQSLEIYSINKVDEISDDDVEDNKEIAFNTQSMMR
jgi:hypothetical protein